MKLADIDSGTIIYICALTSEGIDAESISRRTRVTPSAQSVNVHDTHIIAATFNNWCNKERKTVKLGK